MADVVGTMVVRLATDAKALNDGLDEAKSKFGGFTSVLQGMGQALGQGVMGLAADAGRAIVQFGSDSIKAASDLNETLGKTNVLFGASAGAVVAWSQTTATSIGQTQEQAMSAAATFAMFGSAAGLTGDELVSFSTGFTELASDLASFNNTTPDQAIQAIGAALRGESEPLRAYGVMLDDAAIRAKAMELGIYDGSGALTQQQKILAAQALIYAQTGAAQGDFARTSDGLANQQRILDAQMENLKSTVGQALLPVMLELTRALNYLLTNVLPPMVDWWKAKVKPGLESVAGAIRSIVGPAVTWITGLFKGFGDTTKAQADGPMAYLRRWFDENMPRIRAIVETVLGAIQTFWTNHGATIMGIVNPLLEAIRTIFGTVFRNILDIVTIVLSLLSGDTNTALTTMHGIVERTLGAIFGIFKNIFDSIRDLITGIDWAGLGRAIVDGMIRGIGAMASFLANAARSVATGALDAIKAALGISSPSKVAARTIGEPIAEGIGVGMMRSLGDVGRQLQTGVRGMVGGLQMPALAGAGVTSGGLTINVTVNGSGNYDTGRAVGRGVLDELRARGIA